VQKSEDATPARIAIIGCGVITRTGHLPAALRSPRIELAALIDTKAENALALARSFGLECPVAPTLDAVPGRVDGVVIATPNHTHTTVAAAALARGIPTLIEKPLTISSADAEQLCALADRHGTFISVAYRSRHWPNVKLLKRLLDDGYFGQPQSFHYELGAAGGYSPASGFSVDRAQAGGGILIDTHVIDKILYWFGEPDEVQYSDDNHGGVEANCKGRLVFERRPHRLEGTFFLSRTASLRNALTMRTDRFTVTLSESQPVSIGLVDAQEPGLRLELSDSGPGGTLRGKTDFQVQIEEFAGRIRGEASLTVDGPAGARTLRLVERLYQCRTPLDEPWLVAYQHSLP
jgi:predicted dehydrogenase